MDNILKDSRFAHITKDARFKKIPKKEKKVKIDKRFQSMFTDERFQLKSVVDKRGRPLVSKGSEHLERYYDLSDSSDNEEKEGSEDNEEAEEEEEEKLVEEVKNVETNLDAKSIIKSTKLKRKDLTPVVKAKLKDLAVDYARGEGRLWSDSSSDEDSSSEGDDDEVEHDWGELDKDAAVTEDATSRLAVCHMDWDRITAQDLMVLFNSFLPPGGLLKTVTIYPSEFGKARMEEEERQGPTELTQLSTENEQEDETLSQEQREKLRQYQLKRLRYFYAVLQFDTPSTADHVYKECDGLEYESSMNRLDLRFIPDDTEFDQEPKEQCTELPDLSTYKPRLYRTTALTQVKVDLTWDETDPARQEMIRAAHEGKFDDNQMEKFLASSSEEEDEDAAQENGFNAEEQPASEKKAIDKYKALLADIGKKDEEEKEDVSMEVTWDLKLEQKAEEKVKEAMKQKETKTPFEEFLDKKKEKRKKKKELKKSEGGEGEGEQEEIPFSDDELPSDVDLDDPYFKDAMKDIESKPKKGGKKKGKAVVEETEEDKQKKAELELLLMEEAEEGSKNHFSLKKIEENESKTKKKKNLKKRKAEGTKTKVTEDNFEIDVKDERFSAIFTSHLYNVDPAEPNFRKTEAMKALIDEKMRRRNFAEPEPKVAKVNDEKKMDPELSLLVKSVKRKTQDSKMKKKHSK